MELDKDKVRFPHSQAWCYCRRLFVRFLEHGQQSLRFCHIGTLGSPECSVDVSEQVVPLLECLLRGVLEVGSHGTCAFETAVLQGFLAFLVATVLRDFVPQCYLFAGLDVTRRMHHHHIADIAGDGVVVAAVVDEGGVDPDAMGPIALVLSFELPLGGVISVFKG